MKVKVTRAIFFVLMLVFAGQLSWAQLCRSWSETETLGSLDVSLIPEASGVSSSSFYVDQLYHINDSEFPFKIHITDLTGRSLAQVPTDFSVLDAEDTDIGPCPQGSCFFVADIGGNSSRRTVFDVFFMSEQSLISGVVQSSKVSFSYPNGRHDAESFAVHPNGDLYVLSKSGFNLFRTAAARLYRLPYASWSQMSGQVHSLEFVTEIDLYALSGFTIDGFSHIATAMDFSSNGSRLLVLTYGDAFEIAFNDLLQGTLNYETLLIERAVQQESISYLSDSEILYTAEAPAGESPVRRLRCLAY